MSMLAVVPPAVGVSEDKDGVSVTAADDGLTLATGTVGVVVTAPANANCCPLLPLLSSAEAPSAITAINAKAAAPTAYLRARDSTLPIRPSLNSSLCRLLNILVRC
ncbi:hypothetical protein HGA91_02975 [candidate division WWE3 bacterium]|nr:hypothetical protein [candidate division WWE3 bacterium]